MGESLLCAKQVAERLGVSERTAVRLLRQGEIGGSKVGVGRKLWRTTIESVEEYIARSARKDEPPKAA